jgi:hypothetical protein
MSRLLDKPPFAPRDDDRFLAEMNALCRLHCQGCPEYRRVWPDWSAATDVAGLPYLHVGLFKRMLLRTVSEAVVHQRTLTSSTTSGASPSQIVLDRQSSLLQAQSSLAILREMVGSEMRPLVVLDDARALRRREVTARIAAAMSVKPLASEIHFVLDESVQPPVVRWDSVAEVLRRHENLLVYGFTWILWQAWASESLPAEIRALLAGKRIAFVHSGGWKKLESLRVTRETFDARLLEGLAEGSRVVDYYGLVEQVGIIYPLCERGYRHVPRWADVVIRDPWTLEPLTDAPGLLQSMNVLAYGAPYHNVLTEDLGRLAPGECSCGRAGRRFELLGRAPKVEVRGCANV